ncbi:MAG: hypothetical protein WC665_07875 [Sulfurimonas sp.]|jgi:hypothetical protein
MSYGLERLKEIGAQKIHEKTHISRAHVQAVLHESFDDLNKIHFLGFISILEREYDVDLADLKAKGLAYFNDSRNKPASFNSAVFSQVKKKNSHLFLYIILSILLFGAFLYFELMPSMNDNSQIQQIDNSAIENAQKNIEPVVEEKIEDINESVLGVTDNNIPETNATSTINSVVAKTETQKNNLQESVKSLKIIPKVKVWMGYIDIKTNQKYEKNLEKEMSLDVNKSWLLLFGHGNISIEVDGKLEEFNSTQNIRFKYVDGKFSQIDIEEFKQLNKDKKW